MHRIGRTARAGQKGQSILFLNNPEEPYINYLTNKQVKIEEYLTTSVENNLLFKDAQKTLQDSMLKDKDLIDKSQDAFVSFIRYYKEHQLNFIFSFPLLDIGHCGNSFALFKIPRIKEILGKSLISFEM